MGKVIKIDEALWAELSATARRARRTPESVLRKLMRDYLDVEVDRKADVAIREEVQSLGYREGDAVRLVREYRSQLRTRRIGKVGEPIARYRQPRRG